MALVLVVDDEPDIRELVRINLEQAGHRVVTAADGDEALASVRHEPPDALFLDVRMPGTDGWAVLEWECCIKSAEQGAAEGAPFIARHIIQASSSSFDDFAKSGADHAANRRMLGLT